MLRVGPVDGTDDQSPFQCSFILLRGGSVLSTMGTLTVLGGLDSSIDWYAQPFTQFLSLERKHNRLHVHRIRGSRTG